MAAATQRRFAKSLSAFLAGLQAGMVGVLVDAGVDGSERRLAAPQLLGAGKPDGQRLLWQRGDSPGIWRQHRFRPGALCAGVQLAGRGVRDSAGRPAAAAAIGAGEYRVRPCAGITSRSTWWPRPFRRSWFLLDTERTTFLGHALYGVLLARFPVYLPRAAVPPVAKRAGGLSRRPSPTDEHQAARRLGRGGFPTRRRMPSCPTYASSSSIFLAAASSLTMRKLRI